MKFRKKFVVKIYILANSWAFILLKTHSLSFFDIVIIPSVPKLPRFSNKTTIRTDVADRPESWSLMMCPIHYVLTFWAWFVWWMYVCNVIHIFIMIFKWFFTSWAFFFLTQQPIRKQKDQELQKSFQDHTN